MPQYSKMNDKKSICPQCGEPAGVPIAYGYPSKRTIEMEERGEIVIGGCVCWRGAPNRSCVACGFRWNTGLTVSEHAEL